MRTVMQLNKKYSNEIQQARARIECRAARQPAVRCVLRKTSIEAALPLYGALSREEASGVTPSDAGTCSYRKR